MKKPNERHSKNETRIINLEDDSKKEDIDVTELALLSGFAGMVVIWVITCLFW